MTEVILWLRGVLDEDGQIAQAALDEEGGMPVSVDDEARIVIGDHAINVWATAHIGRQHPRHILADIAAKRAILDRYQQLNVGPTFSKATTYGQSIAYEAAIALLASAYSTRPGYREEWRP